MMTHYSFVGCILAQNKIGICSSSDCVADLASSVSGLNNANNTNSGVHCFLANVSEQRIFRNIS